MGKGGWEKIDKCIKLHFMFVSIHFLNYVYPYIFSSHLKIINFFTVLTYIYIPCYANLWLLKKVLIKKIRLYRKDYVLGSKKMKSLEIIVIAKWDSRRRIQTGMEISYESFGSNQVEIQQALGTGSKGTSFHSVPLRTAMG